MRMYKRILAMVLAALLLTMFSLSAFAEEGAPSADNTVQEEAPEEGEIAPPDEDEGIEIAPPEDDGENSEPSEEPDDSGNEEDPGDTEEPSESEEPDESEESDETEEPDPTSHPTLAKDTHPVYIFGDKDKVNPDRSITRAEAAAVLERLLDRSYTPKTTGRFKDVEAGAWYRGEVDTLAELGVINGYGDGTFRPEKSITRAEFTKMLASFAEKTEGGIKFTDVSGHWANPEITTAAALGWINGYSDGTFRPDRPIKRCEAIVMINRALERKEGRDTLKKAGDPLRFIDLPSSHWAYYDVMEAAVPHEFEPGEHWTSYSIPKASRLPGYYNIAGELYKVDGTGRWVTNENDGVLTFGADGRYTTGNAEFDRLLTQFVRQRMVEGDSNQNNYRRMYTYLATLPHLPGPFPYPTEGSTGWEINRATYMIQNRRGNCYCYAALETYCARKFGYQARALSGKVNSTGVWTPHGWTEITLNGTVYMSDSQQKNYWPREDLFMKKYSQLRAGRNYRVNNMVKK